MSGLKKLKEQKENVLLRDFSDIEDLLARTSKHFPYFSRIIFAFKLVEKVDDPNFPTFAVDRRMRLYYNPKMFEILKKNELVACMFHEINHIIRGHIVRRGQTLEDAMNAQVWNIAEDLEINSNMLKDHASGVEGQNLPAFCVKPSQFKDDKGVVFPEDKTCDTDVGPRYFARSPLREV